MIQLSKKLILERLLKDTYGRMNFIIIDLVFYLTHLNRIKINQNVNIISFIAEDVIIHDPKA